MTATDLDRIGRNESPAAVADRIGQATAVEQARAVAEVQAAIVVAQQVPRSMIAAREQMLESCSQMGLAERAFFRYNRAGSMITGESIHLARELARCFGNIQYGLAELRRDDDHGQSEMQAFAWDVQNNTRPSTTFIVPHGRDTKDGRKSLVDLRDIYENNANMGARRLREQIFAVLPKWFIEEAKARCRQTLEDGGGEPLVVRITKALDGFRSLGISQQQLEDRLGRARDRWDATDMAQLGVVFTSLRNGEVTKEEEFPDARVTAAEITGQGEQPTSDDKQTGRRSGPLQAPLIPGEPSGPKATQAQMAKIHALLKDHDVESDDGVRQAIADILGRPVASRSELSRADANNVIDHLERIAPPAEDEASAR